METQFERSRFTVKTIEKFTVEASDLGWKPGMCAPQVIIDGKVFHYIMRDAQGGELHGWHYEAKDGSTLYVFND